MEIKMDIITERYQLSCNRIKEIVTTQEVAENYKEFFQRTANFILMVVNTCDNRSKIVGLEALRAENKALYNDILDEQYNNSYANPSLLCLRTIPMENYAVWTEEKSGLSHCLSFCRLFLFLSPDRHL